MINALVAWGPAAFWAAVLFLLSEAQPGPDTAWLVVPDKVAHLGAYTVLGATLAWARWRAGSTRSFLAFVLAGAAYGILDEWHQSFVAGRDPSMGDALADAAGVVLGFTLLHLFLSARHRGRGGAST